jgi:hypothetical protein
MIVKTTGADRLILECNPNDRETFHVTLWMTCGVCLTFVRP